MEIIVRTDLLSIIIAFLLSIICSVIGPGGTSGWEKIVPLRERF
jgi:hypothetical protein